MKKATTSKVLVRNSVVIDATDKMLGRLATGIARQLQGKHRVDYQPHIDKGDLIVVEHVDKMKVSGKKMEQKEYHHYSGYPGGLKTKILKDVAPAEALRSAVWNMLPKNKLRAQMIKRLTITNA